MVALAEGATTAQPGEQAVAAKGDIRRVDEQEPIGLQDRVTEAKEPIGVEDVLDRRQRHHEIEGAGPRGRRPVNLAGWPVKIDG